MGIINESFTCMSDDSGFDRNKCCYCGHSNKGPYVVTLKDGGSIKCLKCKRLFHPGINHGCRGIIKPHEYNGRGPLQCPKCK